MMIIWLRSALFYALFFPSTLLCCLVLIPAAIAGPNAITRGRILWVCTNLFLARVVLGQKLEVRGLEHVPDGPCILAGQHQSAYDIYALARAVPNTAFVLKQSLSHIPLIGWMMKRSGSIPIDRGAGGAALRKIAKAAKGVFGDGRPLAIYPEGTRTAIDTARPYLPGVAALYRQFPDIPVIPVAINAGLFWPRSTWRRYPGRIVLEFLPPLEAGLDKPEMLTTLRGRLAAAGSALMAESDPAAAKTFLDAQQKLVDRGR